MHLTASVIVRALYDFEARRNDEVSFKKDDKMLVIEQG